MRVSTRGEGQNQPTDGGGPHCCREGRGAGSRRVGLRVGARGTQAPAGASARARRCVLARGVTGHPVRGLPLRVGVPARGRLDARGVRRDEPHLDGRRGCRADVARSARARGHSRGPGGDPGGAAGSGGDDARRACGARRERVGCSRDLLRAGLERCGGAGDPQALPARTLVRAGRRDDGRRGAGGDGLGVRPRHGARADRCLRAWVDGSAVRWELSTLPIGGRRG